MRAFVTGSFDRRLRRDMQPSMQLAAASCAAPSTCDWITDRAATA